MAQYAPVNGDDENNQFDDGTSQKPTPYAKGNPQHTNLVEVRREWQETGR